MAVIDFKNRMKVYEKLLYFQKDETSPLRFTSVEVTRFNMMRFLRYGRNDFKFG